MCEIKWRPSRYLDRNCYMRDKRLLNQDGEEKRRHADDHQHDCPLLNPTLHDY